MNTPALSPQVVAMRHLQLMFDITGLPPAKLFRIKNVTEFLRDFGVRTLPKVRLPKKGDPDKTVVWIPFRDGFIQREEAKRKRKPTP